MATIIYAELSEKEKCLYDAFNMFDINMKGELTAIEVQTLHQDLRFGGISLQQVLASIGYACINDTVERSELFDTLKEMDRRYFLVQDLRWEFSMLDREGKDTISEDQAKWFMQSVHGKYFSRRKWDKWIRSRPVPGSGVSFAEIEVELCNIPNRQEIEDELLEQQRDLDEREKKQREVDAALEEERRLRQRKREEEDRRRAEEERQRRKLKEEAIRKLQQEAEDDKRRKEKAEEERKQKELDEQIRKKKDEEEAEKQKKEEEESANKLKEYEEKKRRDEEKLVDAERTAMAAENSEKEAEEELRRAREKMANASDEKARKEAEELERLAMEKERENRDKRIRYKLKAAVASREREDLEPAIHDFEKAKLSDDDGDLEKAKQLLAMLNAKDGLKKAMAKRMLEPLERAMDYVRKNGFEVDLAPEMAAANKLLLQLRRLERIRAEILELKQSTVAEIRSYSAPPVAVKAVMVATFLLHGHSEKETKVWKTIQALVGKTGKEGLKRRCLEYNPDKLVKDKETSKRAAELLKKYDLDEVRDVSAGAATFYVWATSMIEEAEMRTEASLEDEEEKTADNSKGRKTPTDGKKASKPNNKGSVKHGKINMQI